MASSVVSGRQLEKWEKEREDANRTEIPMPKAARDSFNSMQPNFNALAKFEKKLDRFTQRMEDKDSGVKTEAIVNVMSSTAGAGSGDFHTYRGFRKKENARIADFEAARKEDEARRAWEAEQAEREADVLAKRSKKAAKRARQKEKERERQQAEKRARGEALAAAGGAAAGEEGAGGGVKHQHQPPRAAVDPAQPNT